MTKKNVLIGTVIAAVSAGIAGVIGEVKAHRKYQKGYDTGLKFGYAIRGLEEQAKQFDETHEKCRKRRG